MYLNGAPRKIDGRHTEPQRREEGGFGGSWGSRKWSEHVASALVGDGKTSE